MADGGQTGTPVGGDTVGFTTTTILEEKIKKLAADNNLELESEDSTVAARRLQEAYDVIRSVLLSRGLTLVQISTWQRGEEFQLDIATFWYCKDSGWGGKIIDEVDWTTVFNRLEELKTVSVMDSDGVLLLKSGVVAVGMNLLDINANLGIYP